MNNLSLIVETPAGRMPLRFEVRRLVNAGYVARDRQALLAHIEELAREGVPPPSAVPMIFSLTSDNLVQSDQIEVLGGKTSGEAEYVLLVQGDEVYVGVGSDHTDRALEGYDLPKSKQICKNVLGGRVWRYRDVADHWDQLVLQSWVRGDDGPEVAYQRQSLAAIIPAAELLDLVQSRLADRQSDGLVIFSGTIPVLGGHLNHGAHFRCELFDPLTERRLGCAYQARRVDYLVDPKTG